MGEDIFFAVNAHIEQMGIVEFSKKHIARSGEIKPVGTGTYRIVPCPGCGSDKGCTLYEATHSGTCFAPNCEIKGDGIAMFARLNRISNIDSAKEIARLEGIDTEGGVKPVAGPTPKKEKPNTGQKDPWIESADAFRLRRWVAEKLHENLKANKWALDYQTGERPEKPKIHWKEAKRGHNPAVLESEMVGFAGNRLLVNAAHRDGVEIQNLVRLGVVRIGKGKPYDFFSEGLFVYPHFSDGEVLHFTTKDPDKNKGRNYQLPKKYRSEKWICYGQDALNLEGDLILVEGENDRLAVLSAGWPGVVAINGTNAKATMFKWIGENGHGIG